MEYYVTNYVVAEAKYNTSKLGKLTDGTKQMSDEWIINRLGNAVTPDLAETIQITGYDKLVVTTLPNGHIVTKSLP